MKEKFFGKRSVSTWRFFGNDLNSQTTSATFAVSSTLPKDCIAKKWRTYSTNSQPNRRRHGSVMSLVMRLKEKNGALGDSVEKRSSRRPSTPSFPSPSARTNSLSLLDDDDSQSVFLSLCFSSLAKVVRNGDSLETTGECKIGAAHSCQEFWFSPSPWKCQEEELEDESFCGTTNGHSLFAQKKQFEKERANCNGDILCAEGNTQAYLLSLVAPSDKRVVNIGRSNEDEVQNGHCHRLFSYNPNNLNPYK